MGSCYSGKLIKHVPLQLFSDQALLTPISSLAASELSGIFKTSVWNYTILQACHSDPFALRAVVALGALYKSMKKSHTISATISSVQVSDIDVASQHLAFALKAYDRAISGMRSVTPVPEKTLSLRKALIACLLVYCVEQFLKSPDTAYRQGQSGYALLREWMARKPNRQAGLSSPDSNVVEDELFQELSRLEVQHALRWGEHELLRHQVRKQEGTSSVKTMPAQFTSLDEGRRYQELIMRRSSHLIGEIYACIISSKLESGHETADSPGELVDPCHVPTKLLDERDEYILDIRRWRAAFSEIGSKLIASPDPFVSMGAALLRIQAMDSEISLAGAFFTEECSFDTFLPEAREILVLSRLYSNRSKKMWPEATPIFNLSTGIERPLFGVAVWCRDKELRYEALDILRSEASRDPTKDKARMVTRASYMIWLEEQGRQEDGTIPERARFREIWKLHHYKETSRGLTMICARRLGYPIGRQYPAKREWTRITFTQSEIDSCMYPEQSLNPCSLSYVMCWLVMKF